jgi:FMN reductase
MAVETALRGAAQAGAQTEFIDLAEFDLPLCNGSKDAADYPPGVARLRERVKAYRGLILGTPEYHGGVSGVLKNALDLMGFEEFEGKMIGLVGVGGGAMGAFDALNTLRSVGRALHAWVVPHQAAIAEAWRVFDPSGKVRSEALEKRLLEVGAEVARFARLHSCEDHMGFVKEWENAQPNPGGRST